MHCAAIPVNPVNEHGVRFAMVPKESLETRAAYKQAWFFRINAELQDCVKRGWRIGFCTLTYDDLHLPYLPSSVFSNAQPYEPIPCFSKADCRRFVVSLRKWFFDNHGVVGIKYLLASELGEHTQRPHYHFVVSWPSHVPAVDVHQAIKDCWIEPREHGSRLKKETSPDVPLGFVFPRYYLGGVDSHGFNHLPFEVTDNPIGSARYISKYVCKDLAWLGALADKKLLFKSKEFKEHSCFHLQSRSLGFSMLRTASDSDKLKWLEDGFWFVGQDKAIELPVYIKNKILFNPKYVVDEYGNRLVRRERTQFFKDNYKRIFEIRCKTFERLFTKMFDVNWWLKSVHMSTQSIEYDIRGAQLAYKAYTAFMDKYSFTPEVLSRHYVARFGVHPDQCYNAPLDLQWYSRYCDDSVLNGYPHVDYDSQVEFNMDFLKVLSAGRYFNDSDEREAQRFDNKIQDYWKSTI